MEIKPHFNNPGTDSYNCIKQQKTESESVYPRILTVLDLVEPRGLEPPTS